MQGVPREDGFDITVASEVMAVLCLASDIPDLKARLGRMIVAYTPFFERADNNGQLFFYVVNALFCHKSKIEIVPHIYFFGDKFMVSIGTYDSRDEATEADIAGQAQHGHDLAGHGDVEPVLPGYPLHPASQAVDDVAELAVVHTCPATPSRSSLPPC